DWYWNSLWDNGAFQKGLIGYWNDEADVYGGNLMFMQMQRSNYEGQRRATDQRVWSINRNFFLGSQRYAYAHWSGDIGTSFESMAEQRLFMLSSINLGSSWWGMDIGGFHGTPTPENYIRWIQFGAFVPIFRVHGSEFKEREPWNYGQEAVKIARKYINMRYALMPYIYTQAYQNYKEGQPIVRPLVMDYPDDLQVRNMYSEWMFGDNFLVHPVVSENADQANVYLPEGEWIDFNRGHRYSGSQYINYPVNLEDIPVFVKAGSVIPMKEPGDYVDDPDTKQTLYWHVFPGPTGFFTLYEDNGWDYDYEGRGYSLTQATQHTNPEEITFNLGDRSFPYNPPDRSLFAVFRLITAEPDQVELDGENLQQRELDSLENYTRGWAFQKTGSRVLVKFSDDGLNHKVVLTKGEDTTPPAIDTVSVLDQNSVQLVFDEAVQAGNAEKFDSYSFEPELRINSIQLEQDQRAVNMNCSDLEINKDYKLTIQNIADTSTNQNILSDTSLYVAYRPFGDYSWVLQNGLVDYSGCSDTHIGENQSDNNMGGYEFFECCRFAGVMENGEDDKHALVKFDLQSVASKIDSLKKAELILTLARTRNGSPDKSVASYRITKNWQEGNTGNNIDGNYASDGEVTWTHALFNQEEWQTQGGDYYSDYSDLVNVGSTAGTNLRWDVTDLVKFWINKPDSNFGVLLKEPQTSTENGTKVFYSSQHDIQKFRPKLGLIYGDDQVAIASQSLTDRPDEFQLQQNYPNPFNPRTSIAYQIPAEGQVKLEVFNLLGQKVATLVNNYQKPGRYKTVWQAGENSSGIYIYRLSLVNGSQRFIEQKKMILMK
ncbi:MAG: DNRLRE domain-containing protein, partial [Candidatus Marinimicrobia bacterium]|nr:DNRLRE domain-containing protein [Candidatus Neomarinimicrobiota bacterium]